jgi:cytochrome c-type biogenesis protein CcmH
MRLIVVAVLAGSLIAAAESPEQIAGEISREIMSPFCDGVTLHDCPSAEADELRRTIARWAGDGVSKDEIIDRLEAEYGRTIHGSPQNAAARLLPLAAAAAGIGLAVVLVKRWARRRPPGSPRALTADERARLDAELGPYREAP